MRLEPREHRFVTLDTMRSLVSTETGVSDWVTIEQADIDAFADLTGDWQFLHVDPERAAETPFGTTIAHGFLTMSLLSWMGAGPRPRLEGTKRSVNYGFDRLRFVGPVPTGSRIRGRFVLADVVEGDDGEVTTHWDVTIEVDGHVRPALVGRWLNRAWI